MNAVYERDNIIQKFQTLVLSDLSSKVFSKFQLLLGSASFYCGCHRRGMHRVGISAFRLLIKDLSGHTFRMLSVAIQCLRDSKSLQSCFSSFQFEASANFCGSNFLLPIKGYYSIQKLAGIKNLFLVELSSNSISVLVENFLFII